MLGLAEPPRRLRDHRPVGGALLDNPHRVGKPLARELAGYHPARRVPGGLDLARVEAGDGDPGSGSCAVGQHHGREQAQHPGLRRIGPEAQAASSIVNGGVLSEYSFSEGWRIRAPGRSSDPCAGRWSLRYRKRTAGWIELADCRL